jgi:predicted cobalt transporter CbtA
MRATFTAAITALAFTITALPAQTPAPIIVQAMTPESANAPRVAPPPAAPAAEGTLKLLEEIKAANAAVLSKQTETLQQLDELEKAADQIRIFSKRG